MNPPAVRLAGVNLNFGPSPVLKDVSLTVGSGRIASIVGMTGAGKTTILKLIAGLLTPTRGTVLLEETPAQQAAKQLRIAYVFQQATLIPWLTALQNVLLPCELRGEIPETTVAEHWLQEVDSWGVRHQFPHELSGGQAMRVSLARALIQQPHVLLLDEPFAALDTVTRRRMQGLLLDLHARQPCTVVLVTHEVPEAVSLADDLYVLAGTAGAGIVAHHPYQWPQPRPAGFLSHPALIQAVDSVLTALTGGGV